MLMFENEGMLRGKFDKINEVETEQSSSPEEDMEINCVFCGILFDSIDGVQKHITEVHENNNIAPVQNNDDIKNKNNVKQEAIYPAQFQIRPYFSTSGVIPEKLTVFDAHMKIVEVEQIKLEQVKLCMRCNRHFLNEECLTHHQFSEHAIRKRKRSSHPNCVEGIVVTLDGTWGCDICARVFATLKQAKVHKFKSHIEPAQKQEIMSTEFSRRYSTYDDNSSPISQQFRQILPNDGLGLNIPMSLMNSSPSVTTVTPIITPPLRPEPAFKYNTSGAMDLSQSSSPSVSNNVQAEPIWTIRVSNNQDTKISLSKVVQEPLISKEETNQKNSAFFAYNSATSQYACSHCPAMFSSRAVYSRHILVHRRGKAFVCDGCGMAFTRNHTLKQHKDSKCIIANPIVGTNCQFVDQCPKCGHFFASSNSHLSHCRKICKISFGNNVEESTRDSIKSEETSAQCEGNLEIDLGESDTSTPMLISDFINNPSFVTKGTNEFNCNLCSCYFPSFKSIGHHLENYHRIDAKKRKFEPAQENASNAPSSNESLAKLSPHPIEVKREDNWWPKKDVVHTPQKSVPESPPPQMLTPNNFSLLPFIGMSRSNSHEILNLSTNSSPSVNRNTMLMQFQYKPRNSRKYKIQPNANGDFECTECHKAFGCRSSLSNHVKSHFNLRNKPFSCVKCGQGFMSNMSYEEHVKSQCANVHGINATTTGQMASSGTVMYSVGGASPSSSRSTSCMHCNATFSDRSLLEDHAAREHSNENGEVQCIKCTRSFSTYMAFRVHMTKSHGGPNGTPLKNSLNVASSLPYLSPYPTFVNTSTTAPCIIYKCTTCNKDFFSSHTFEEHKGGCVAPSVSVKQSLTNESQAVMQ